MKKGWETKKLSDLCASFRPAKAREGTGPYVEIGDVDVDTKVITSKAKGAVKGSVLAPGGCVLVSKVRPTRGAIAILESDSAVSSAFAILKPREHLDLRLLFYGLAYSDEFSAFLGRKQTGLLYPSVKEAEILSFEISYPTCPQQQRRIVRILDEAFEAIATAKANAEKNLQNARELFAGHLRALFSQRGNGWVSKTVQQWVDDGVLAKPQDGNHGEIHPTKADYVEVGVPFIMAADLIDGMVDTVGCRFIAREQASSLRIGFAKTGDVLLSHKGTIGRVAILDTSDDYVILTPQVTYYRSMDSSRLLIEFLYYCLLSPEFQVAMNRIAGAGSTRAYIGITRQLDLQMTLPPVSVQREMAVRLRRIDEATNRLAEAYQARLAALDELRRSLLHQAFTGLLTANSLDGPVAEVA